jgi:hypothetical protein
MHLLEAWLSLPILDLARLVGIPALVLVTALLPGRRVAAGAAIALAVSVAALEELPVPAAVRGGWVLLWLLVAWQAGARGLGDLRGPSRRRGGIEAGVLALPLGFGLLLLLLAALSRQGLGAADARRASLGALVLGAGLLHLMLRRQLRRAFLAFAALGLGLELLAASARAEDVLHAGPPAGAGLAGAGAAVALAWRITDARERVAGSSLVGDAHELHD